MASYPPPTGTPAQFDSSLFPSTTGNLTIELADTLYLKHPVAQGAQTMKNTTVDGTLTVSGTTSIDDILIVADGSNTTTIQQTTSTLTIANDENSGVINVINKDALGATSTTLSLSKTTSTLTTDALSIVTPTLPTTSASLPIATDSSNKIPTTAWVQQAITAAGGASNVGWSLDVLNSETETSYDVVVGGPSNLRTTTIYGTTNLNTLNTDSTDTDTIIVNTTATIPGTLNATGSSNITTNNSTVLSNYNGQTVIRPRTLPVFSGTIRTATSEATLTTAINNAVNGDIINILNDITLTISGVLLVKQLKLTAVNKNIKLTSALGSTLNIQSDNVLIQGLTIENTSTGSTATCITNSTASYSNVYIDNCNIITNEFGVVSGSEQIQITNCAFSFTGTPDSHRYISLSRTTGATIIDNNTFAGNGGVQATAATRLIQLETGTYSGSLVFTNNNNIGLNAISQVINTNGSTFTGFKFYLMNNTFTIANGYLIVFGTGVSAGINSIYAFNNIEYTETPAVLSKGIVAFDGSGVITQVPIYAQNNFVNALRLDYTDMTQQRNRVVAYSSTMTAPTFVVDLQNISNVVQLINADSLYGETVGATNLSGVNIKALSTTSNTVSAPVSLTTPTISGVSNSLAINSDTITITGANPPTSTATQPAFTDSTTKIPTTAWVQGAISSNNVWSYNVGTNTASTTANTTIGTSVPGGSRVLTVNGSTVSDSVSTENLVIKDATTATLTSTVIQNGTDLSITNDENLGRIILTTKDASGNTVSSTIESDLLTVNQDQVVFNGTTPIVSNAVQPPSNDSTSNVPTTAWVQSAITAAYGGWNYDVPTNTTSTTANVVVGTTLLGGSRNILVNGNIDADRLQSEVLELPTGSTATGITVNTNIEVANGSSLVFGGSSGTIQKLALAEAPNNTTLSLKGKGGKLAFFTHNATNVDTERITVLNNSGLVGINQTTPTRTLDVNGDIGSTTLTSATVSATSNLYAPTIAPASTGNVNLTINGSGTGTVATRSKGGDIIMSTNFGGTDFDRMTIKNNSGFIGINNSNPTSVLDVFGTTKASDFVAGNTVTTPSIITPALKAGTTGNVNMSIEGQGTGNIIFRVGPSTSQVMEIFDNGQVTITDQPVGPSLRTRLTVESGYTGDFDEIGLNVASNGGTGPGAKIKQSNGLYGWTSNVNNIGRYQMVSDNGDQYLELDGSNGGMMYYTNAGFTNNGLHITNQTTTTASNRGGYLDMELNGSVWETNVKCLEPSGAVNIYTKSAGGNTAKALIAGGTTSQYNVSLPDSNSRLGITTTAPTSKLDMGTAIDSDKLLSIGNTGVSAFQYYGMTTNNTSSKMYCHVPSSAHTLVVSNGFGGTARQEKFLFAPTAEPRLTFNSSASNTGIIGLGAIASASGTNDFGVYAGTNNTVHLMSGTGAIPQVSARTRQVSINTTPANAGTVPTANLVSYPNPTYPGTVSTSGVNVTGTGTNFLNLFAPGDNITINSVAYTIATVPSSASLTLTTSAGTQTGQAYSSTTQATRPMLVDQRGAMFFGDNAVPATAPNGTYTPKGINAYCAADQVPQIWGLQPTLGGTWRGGSTYIFPAATNSNHFQFGSHSSGSALGFYTQFGSVTAYLRTDGVFIGNFQSPSDMRIKKNIQDLDDNECLEILRKVEPKKYQYNDEQQRGSDYVYGFIAQQVQEVCPCSTSVNENYTTDAMANVISRTNNGDNTTTLVLDKPYEVITGDSLVLRDSYTMMSDDCVVVVADNSVDPYTIIVQTDTIHDIGDIEEHPYITVVGKNVSDFLTLNKDTLFTVAFSALQQIDKKVSQLETLNGIASSTSSPYVFGSSGRLTINNFSASINTPYNLASFTAKPPTSAHKVKLSVNFTCAESVNSAVATNCTLTRVDGSQVINLAHGNPISQTGCDIGTPLSPINIKNVLASSSSSGLGNAGHSYNITITDNPNTTNDLSYNIRWATSFSSTYYFSNVNYTVEYVL